MAVNQPGTENPVGSGNFYLNTTPPTFTGTCTDATSGVQWVHVHLGIAQVSQADALADDANAEGLNANGYGWMNATINSDGTWTFTLPNGYHLFSGFTYYIYATAEDNVNHHVTSAEPAKFFIFEELPTVHIDRLCVNGEGDTSTDAVTADYDVAGYGRTTYLNGFTTVTGTASDGLFGPGAVVGVSLQITTGSGASMQYLDAAGGWTGTAATWLPATSTSPFVNAGAASAPSTYNIQSWSFTIPGTPFSDAKAYTINVRAIDNIGQYSVVRNRSFTLDTTGPAITFGWTIPADVYSFEDIYGTATDATSGVCRYSFDYSIQNVSVSAPPSDLAWNTHTANWKFDLSDYSFTNNDQYTITIYATDNAGNTTSVTSVPFTYHQMDDKMNLSNGWNFISFPKRLAADSATFGDLFTAQGITVVTGYSYDPVNGWVTLTPTTHINVLDGYWVDVTIDARCAELAIGFNYSTDGQTVPASKALVGNAWNAIGVSSTYGIDEFRNVSATTPDDTYNQSGCPLAVVNQLKSIENSWSTLFSYNAPKQNYNPAIIAPGEYHHMVPGMGYWIFISEAAGDTLCATGN